jgi:predicted Na+-dependent transporter
MRPHKPSMGTRAGVLRSLVMATGALAIYGGLAFAANWEHGVDPALRAFAAQGALSAVNTFIVTMLMERLARFSPHRTRAFALAAGGGSAWAGLLTVVVHWAASTPNFALTVVPIVVWGAFYCAFYAAALVRRTHPKAELAPERLAARIPAPARGAAHL